jgi:hypothetical protein
MEESLQSCFVVATSTSPASGSDPQSADSAQVADVVTAPVAPT